MAELYDIDFIRAIIENELNDSSIFVTSFYEQIGNPDTLERYGRKIYELINDQNKSSYKARGIVSQNGDADIVNITSNYICPLEYNVRLDVAYNKTYIDEDTGNEITSINDDIEYVGDKLISLINNIKGRKFDIIRGKDGDLYVTKSPTFLQIPLYRVASGVKDSIELADGVYTHIKNIRKMVVTESDITGFEPDDGETYFDKILISMPINYTYYNNIGEIDKNATATFITGFPAKSYANSSDNINTFFYHYNTTKYTILVPKGSVSSLSDAKTKYAGLVIYYETDQVIDTHINNNEILVDESGDNSAQLYIEDDMILIQDLNGKTLANENNWADISNAWFKLVPLPPYTVISETKDYNVYAIEDGVLYGVVIGYTNTTDTYLIKSVTKLEDSYSLYKVSVSVNNVQRDLPYDFNGTGRLAMFFNGQATIVKENVALGNDIIQMTICADDGTTYGVEPLEIPTSLGVDDDTYLTWTSGYNKIDRNLSNSIGGNFTFVYDKGNVFLADLYKYGKTAYGDIIDPNTILTLTEYNYCFGVLTTTIIKAKIDKIGITKTNGDVLQISLDYKVGAY